MNKKEIIDLLEKKHQELFDWLKNQSEDAFKKGPEGKWTTGQHIVHLVNSIQQVNRALSYPKFLLKYKFGKSNREVRTYDAIVKRYQEKLSKNQDKAREFNIAVKLQTKKSTTNYYMLFKYKIKSCSIKRINGKIKI